VSPSARDRPAPTGGVAHKGFERSVPCGAATDGGEVTGARGPPLAQLTFPHSAATARQLAPPPFGAQRFDNGEIPMGLDEVLQPVVR